MGVSHPVSGRKVRAATQEAVNAVNEQGKFLERFGLAVAAHEDRLQYLERVVYLRGLGIVADIAAAAADNRYRGFWGRLRWLLWGN